MKLKVITFNIRCCDDPNGHAISERVPRVAALCEDYAPDVIGLQEYTPAWDNYIGTVLGDKYEMFMKYRCSEGWIETAPILWKKDKFECVKKGYFWLSDTPEVESRGWDTLSHNRICLYAVLKDKESGESFTFMNTHFGFGDECQIKSAQLVHKYFEAVSELPTFITGDFNMNPKTVGYAEMVKKLTDVNAVCAKDMRSTYHGYDPSVEYDEHIDYCFVNGKVKPICNEIIDKTFDGKFPSDHFGVYFEIEV